MGHLRRGRAPARLVLALLLASLAALVLAAPGQAKRFSTNRVEGNTVTDMSWGIDGITLFAAPTSPPGQRTPSIDGTLVACRVGRATNATGFNVRYRWLGGAGGVWGGPGPQVQPAVSDGLIAGLDNGVVSVFDPTTGLAVPVSTGAVSPSAPAFSGDTVVWQDKTGDNWDIYGRRFDRVAGQPTGDVFPICTAPGDQTAPAIDGDVVVWQDHRGGDWDVYGYDLVAQQEFPVSSARGDQCKPDICGDTIAWQDSRKGNWDIYAHDMDSEQTEIISRARGAQTYPAVSSDLIVWQDEQPRYVQADHHPTVRYTYPYIAAYSLTAGADLDELWDDYDGIRETRPDASGAVAVFQKARGARAPGALRVTGARLSELWAYSIRLQPDYFWVNTRDLTLTIDVLVCPTPPVTQVGFDLTGSRWTFPDLVWEPFEPSKTVTLPEGDGRKLWWVSLKDSAGDTPGDSGSEVMLDTHGPACWAPYPVTVKSGGMAALRYKVTDRLSPQARALITVKRTDGSVVQRIKARAVNTGKLVSRRVLCDLRPGAYSFEVTATDLAGNKQVRIGTNTLTVR